MTPITDGTVKIVFATLPDDSEKVWTVENNWEAPRCPDEYHEASLLPSTIISNES